jgi:hypothetical protein
MAMAIWKLPPDFWTAVQKGVQHYKDLPLEIVTPQPDDPQALHSAATFINLLRQAYRSQSEVGLENFMKGRIVQQW